MKINEDYLSIRKVANLIDVSDHTISRWYKWWESPEFEKPEGLVLPPYVHKDLRKTKFFKKSDIPKLEEFAKALRTTHKGAMSEFNAAYQWGKRGDKILESKGTNRRNVQAKMR